MRSEKLKGKSNKEPEEIRQRAYKFALEVVRLSKQLPNTPSGWAIASQIIRSSTSISANLVEAKGASSRADFRNFYHYSLKSTYETIHWLCIIRDLNEVKSVEAVKFLIVECTELSKIISSIIIKLKK